MPNKGQVVYTFDKSQVDDAIDGMKSGFKSLAENVNISSTEMAGSFKRNWDAIPETSKAMAASVTADQRQLAESLVQTTLLSKENARALRAAVSPYGEAKDATGVLAATQVRLAEAYALSTANIKAQRDAAAQSLSTGRANQIVGGAAAGGAADTASRMVAAATLEEMEAKNQLRSVTEALGDSSASQAEKELALANVQTRVRDAVALRSAAELELRGALQAAAEAEAVRSQTAEGAAAANKAASEALRAVWQQELNAQDLLIEKNAELARSREMTALRANIETRAGQAAAWEQEVIAQDRLIEKNAELTRSREMAALKSDILARSELSSWQQELIAQDRLIEKNAELARARELGALKANILSRAEGDLADASHAAVTGQIAVGSAMRDLSTGNAGIRALENFFAKTLGLGPVFQNLFPILGGVAFVQLLARMGKEIYDLEQKGKHAADELARGFGEMNEKLIVSNDELALTNSKLEDQLGKLSGNPTNGLKTALLEAKVAADKLQESLAGDLKQLNELLKQNNVGNFESLLSGVGATGGQTKEIADYGKQVERQGREARAARVKAIAEAGADNDKQEAANRAYYDRMDRIAADAAAHMRVRATQIAEDQANMDAAAVEAAKSGRAGGARTQDLSQRRDKFEDAANVYDDLQGRAQLSGSSFATQKKIGQAKQDKANDAGDSDDAAKAQLKDIEAQFAELNEATANIKGHGLTSEDALAFWAPYLGTFAARSDEAKKILQEVAKAQDGIHKQILDGSKKIKAEQDRVAEEGVKVLPKTGELGAKMLKEQSDEAMRAGEKWAGYWAAVNQGQEQAARAAEEIALTRVKLDEENGSLSHVAAAQKTAELHAKEHTSALAALNKELERLQFLAALAPKNPVTGALTDPKLAKELQDAQNKVNAETGKGDKQKGQDQKAVADAMAKPYLAAFNAIENGWMTAQRAMLTGQQSLGQAMKQMWGGIAMSAIQSFERTQLDWAKKKILMVAQHAAASSDMKAITLAEELYNKIMHTGTAAAKAATDADAAAAQQATAVTANVATAQSYAAVAGAAGVASTAAIPVVGPALAPAAGAAMFGVASTYTALAAFEQGTMYVPRAGAAVLHPGEAVLGSPSAQVMRDAMSGKLTGAGGGGDVHLHMGGNTINGNGGDFAAQLSQHETHLAGMLSSMHRRGKLNFAR